ncbi:Hsp33 family molecular chaperone HslO, partial [Mycobacterium tuberculosis]|nr:Hsp33 family molecular chaperone HslO [Mycobacterium tuberculosis]
VQMLVVQCGSDLSMRATAKFAGDSAQTIGDDTRFASLVNASGHGRCVITIDPADKLPGQQPYQGIVPLNGVDGPLESVSQVLEHYMHH